MTPSGIKFTINYQPKIWGKYSILWAHLVKNNRLSLNHSWHLLGSKSKIHITIWLSDKKVGKILHIIGAFWENNWGILCICGIFWDQNHTWLSEKKKWMNQNLTLLLATKMLVNAWYYRLVLRKKLTIGVGLQHTCLFVKNVDKCKAEGGGVLRYLLG